MNKSVVMIMGGALIVAIVVAMLVQMKLAPKKEPETATTGAEVLIANKALMTGETIKAEDVHWASLPEAAIFTGMIKRKDQADENKLEVYGKPLRRNIESGEPVTMQAVIADAGTGNFLAASLGPGMRAVAVLVKAETTAGGFITPGDYVDVLISYQLTVRGDAENVSALAIQKFGSETLLSNVKVLAVDQSAKEEGHEAKVARTVTLEVDKKGAQVLALAGGMGDISLALRRLGEKDTVLDAISPITTDVTTSKVLQEIYNIAEKSRPMSDTVRVYNGSNVTNVPVRPSAPQH